MSWLKNHTWLSFALTGLILALPSFSLALTNPIDRSAAVTATVPVSSPGGEPDTPVLIAPANNSTISTRAPSFIFNPALGSIRTSHYQLWIDGAKNLDHIGAAVNTIIVQPNGSLTEGSHTWSVQAIGSNGVSRNSATWAFTIDTTAPLILLTQVAGQTASLSSLDLSPWQKEVIFTTADRYPVINGQGEAGASLNLSLNDMTINTQIGIDRQFSVKPTTALLPGRYTVSVSSSDQAGNQTSLPSFFLDILAGQAPLVINLPSPLPRLEINIPVAIPESLTPVTAFPLIPAAPAATNYLVWLIIISYLAHILCLNRLIHRLYRHHSIKNTQFILLYITLLLPTALMIWLAKIVSHWLPLILGLLSGFVLLIEFKLIKSKYIKIEQF